MSSWTMQEIDGYTAWVSKTELMEIIVVPSLGSKVISLKHRKTNREWGRSGYLANG